MPIVEYNTRYVSARPTMASLLSSSPHFSPGTVMTRLCIKAMGSEFEFMNMADAIANDLCAELEIPTSHIRDRQRTFVTSSTSG